MRKSLSLSVVLLTIILLVSAGSVLARTGGTSVPIPVVSATHLELVASATNPSQIVDKWASSIFLEGPSGDEKDDKDKEKGDKDDDDHKPTPEPSTILSFGVALLVGGGVFFSRRLRRNQK